MYRTVSIEVMSRGPDGKRSILPLQYVVSATVLHTITNCFSKAFRILYYVSFQNFRVKIDQSFEEFKGILSLIVTEDIEDQNHNRDTSLYTVLM